MSDLSRLMARLIPLTTLVLILFLLGSLRQWSITDRLIGHVEAACGDTCIGPYQCTAGFCRQCYIPPCCTFGYCSTHS